MCRFGAEEVLLDAGDEARFLGFRDDNLVGFLQPLLWRGGWIWKRRYLRSARGHTAISPSAWRWFTYGLGPCVQMFQGSAVSLCTPFRVLPSPINAPLARLPGLGMEWVIAASLGPHQPSSSSLCRPYLTGCAHMKSSSSDAPPNISPRVFSNAPTSSRPSARVTSQTFTLWRQRKHGFSVVIVVSLPAVSYRLRIFLFRPLLLFAIGEGPSGFR